MRHPFWVGLAVGAIGTVTTLVTNAKLNHRAEQRALRRAAGKDPAPSEDPTARWLAPNYGESEFR